MRALLLAAAMTLALAGSAYARIASNGKSLNGASLNGAGLNGVSLNGTTLAADSGTTLDLGALTVVKATIRR